MSKSAVSLDTATKKSILSSLCQHAQVPDTKSLRTWILTTYYSDTYTPQLDDQGQPIPTVEAWAYDLHHKNRNFRSLEHLRELFTLLEVDASGLEARQIREKQPAKPKITWATIVRNTVHWIADHSEAAKAAVDAMPDEHLRFTSLKSFKAFADGMELQANSHSDDPVKTLAAELCLMTGTQNLDQLRTWVNTKYPGDTSDLATWNLEDHQTLLNLQRVILDIQQGVAA